MDKIMTKETKRLGDYAVIAWMLLVLIGLIALGFIEGFLEGTPLHSASIFIRGFRLPLLFIACIVIVSRASIKPYGFGQVLLAVLPYIAAFLLTMALAFVIESIAVALADIKVFLILSREAVLCICWVLFFALAARRVARRSSSEISREKQGIKRIAVIGAGILVVIVSLVWHGFVYPALFPYDYTLFDPNQIMLFLMLNDQLDTIAVFESLGLFAWWLLALAATWCFSIETRQCSLECRD